MNAWSFTGFISLFKKYNTRRTFLTRMLFFVVIFSCVSLMLLNGITIRLLSGNRAFISVVGELSITEKDALKGIQRYIELHDEQNYSSFLTNYKIINADSLAMHELLNGGSESQITENLLKGGNDPGDIRTLIWEVNNFHRLPQFQNIISIWKAVFRQSGLIEKKVLGIHRQIHDGHYTRAQAIEDSRLLNLLDDRMTELELKFSDQLSNLSRSMNKRLLVLNCLLILFIVSIKCLYSYKTIRQLIRLLKVKDKNNRYMIRTNQELDRFIYSASHELRTPITSLRGLMPILKEETDLRAISEYLVLMDASLTHQDFFIGQIINYSRNKRTELSLVLLNLRQIVDEVINHHQWTDGAESISFRTELDCGLIVGDLMRYKIILNNLISNAIKFSDHTRANKIILIRCTIAGDNLQLDVQDNGIGVDTEFSEKIFEMFFVTRHPNRGAGLGLYIIRETALKMNGTISLRRLTDGGSCFTLLVPHNRRADTKFAVQLASA